MHLALCRLGVTGNLPVVVDDQPHAERAAKGSEVDDGAAGVDERMTWRACELDTSSHFSAAIDPAPEAGEAQIGHRPVAVEKRVRQAVWRVRISGDLTGVVDAPR